MVDKTGRNEPLLEKFSLDHGFSNEDSDRRKTALFGLEESSSLVRSGVNPLSESKTSQQNTITQSLSGVTLGSRGRNTSNNQPGVTLKLHQSWFDHFKIFMYHFIEPVLLAIAMGLSLQLPTLSTLVYTLLMFLGMFPCVLSANQTSIKFKVFLSLLMIVIGLAFIVYKSVMIYRYNRDPAPFEAKQGMWRFLGVYGGNTFLTLSIDICQVLICAVLAWHLNDQRKQASRRLTVVARLDYQTEIKLHHPYFGRRWKVNLFLTLLLFLFDTFVMLSFPQLIIVVLLTVLMLFWHLLVAAKHKTILVVIRVVQTLTTLQIVAAFLI